MLDDTRALLLPGAFERRRADLQLRGVQPDRTHAARHANRDFHPAAEGVAPGRIDLHVEVHPFGTHVLRQAFPSGPLTSLLRQVHFPTAR